ncbi:MAG: hypothetical protein ACK47U_01540, partial [Verrucomicrobiota bacterium]
MERLILLLAALAVATPAFAQPTLVGDAPVAVFEAKQNLTHAAVRFPALLRTTKGTLFAVAEAREKATDQAGNDLVIATSRDDGVNWSKPRVAYDQGKDRCNNPTLVEDELIGRVYL